MLTQYQTDSIESQTQERAYKQIYTLTKSKLIRNNTIITVDESQEFTNSIEPYFEEIYLTTRQKESLKKVISGLKYILPASTIISINNYAIDGLYESNLYLWHNNVNLTYIY